MKITIPDRRYVYVLNVRHRSGLPSWIGKVGFSVDSDNRASDVERSIWQVSGEKMTVRRMFQAKVFMYRKIESVVHSVLRFYRCNRFEGASGGTEFFYEVNPFIATVLTLLYWGYGGQCPMHCWLFIAAIPLPIDFIVYVILLAAVEYVLAGLAIWLLWTLGRSLIYFL